MSASQLGITPVPLGLYNSSMVNSVLVLLYQIGGIWVVVAVTLYLMGRYFLRRIDSILTAYGTAYSQQTAAIDARLSSIDKLSDEQSRLTRTVEGVKDDITTAAKSRDTRWAFRKEVYVNMLNVTTDLTIAFNHLLSHAEGTAQFNPLILQDVAACGRQFSKYTALADLATADSVRALVQAVLPQVIETVRQDDPERVQKIRSQIGLLLTLKDKLAVEGRKDLWGAGEA
jgi:phage-related protein